MYRSRCPLLCPSLPPPLLPGCSWTCKKRRPPLPGRASLGYSPHFSARTEMSALYEPDLPAFTSPPSVLSLTVWTTAQLSPAAQLTCCLLTFFVSFCILLCKICPGPCPCVKYSSRLEGSPMNVLAYDGFHLVRFPKSEKLVPLMMDFVKCWHNCQS